MEEVYEGRESTDVDEISLGEPVGAKPFGVRYMHVCNIVSNSPA